MSQDQSIMDEFNLSKDQRDLYRAIMGEIEARLGKEAGKGPDRTYKGDEYWLTARRLLLLRIQRHTAVCYSDIASDIEFLDELQRLDPGGRRIDQSSWWTRALRQHFAKNRPPGEDDFQIVEFRTNPGTRATVWATRRDWLHCALHRAWRRESREGKPHGRWLVDQYRGILADGCTKCGWTPRRSEIDGEEMEEVRAILEASMES